LPFAAGDRRRDNRRTEKKIQISSVPSAASTEFVEPNRRRRLLFRIQIKSNRKRNESN